MLVSIAFLFATCLFMGNIWQNLPTRWTTMTPQDTRDDVQDLDPGPYYRTLFSDKGTIVKGWPSTKGGIYILQACYGVELDFLGLDHFESAIRSENPAEEDAHCANMCKLGAQWWESDKAYEDYQRRYPNWNEQRLVVGWPDRGGVWVIKITRRNFVMNGVGRVHNALNMEERCQMIEQLGGTFYANPNECPDLDV